MAAPARPVVRVSDLTFARQGVTVLSGVDLEVLERERLAVVGPSGAGKTTLLRLVAGLETPTSGTVEVRPGGAAGGGSGAGMVFQDLGLFPHMRVWSNVAFALRARGEGRRERREQALAALRRAGLDGLGERYPSQLSGGERQRVALLRTLVSEPAALLLDEPFASLDAHLVERFAEWVNALGERAGIPLILVTHDVGFALGWADRIAVVREGLLLQVATPRALYEAPRDEFVARFVGPCNVLDATVLGTPAAGQLECTVDGIELPLVAAARTAATPGTRVRVLVRPDALRLDGGCALAATVAEVRYRGGTRRYRLDCAAGPLVLEEPSARTALARGDRAAVCWPPERAAVIDR